AGRGRGRVPGPGPEGARLRAARQREGLPPHPGQPQVPGTDAVRRPARRLRQDRGQQPHRPPGTAQPPWRVVRQPLVDAAQPDLRRLGAGAVRQQLEAAARRPPRRQARRPGDRAVSRAPLPLAPEERLIFALDVPGRAEAVEWIDRLGDSVRFYKIGMELLASGEYFQVLDLLGQRGKRVFVDLKFFDIPATVAGVIRGLGRWKVDYCTIHGWHPAMMQAAAEANQGDMRLLAVTVLTSMEGADLRAMGIDAGPEQVVVQRALAAQAAGIDGVIASGREAGPIRAATGDGFSIVCPGIRPDG